MHCICMNLSSQECFAVHVYSLQTAIGPAKMQFTSVQSNAIQYNSCAIDYILQCFKAFFFFCFLNCCVKLCLGCWDFTRDLPKTRDLPGCGIKSSTTPPLTAASKMCVELNGLLSNTVSRKTVISQWTSLLQGSCIGLC